MCMVYNFDKCCQLKVNIFCSVLVNGTEYVRVGRKIMVNYKRICKVSCCGLSFEEMVGLILELRF